MDVGSNSPRRAEFVSMCRSARISRRISYCARIFFGPAALKKFIPAFKTVVAAVVLLGTLDTLSGRNIIHETVANIFWGMDGFLTQYRFGIARSLSTFDHSILFGAFCTIAATIFLYSEFGVSQIFFVGLSLLGVLLSIASAAILASAMVIIIYCFDRMFRRYSRRWHLLWGIVATLS